MYNCLDTLELDILLEQAKTSIDKNVSVLIVANFADMDNLTIVEEIIIEKVRLASEGKVLFIFSCI